jgi:hypothetical protein
LQGVAIGEAVVASIGLPASAGGTELGYSQANAGWFDVTTGTDSSAGHWVKRAGGATIALSCAVTSELGDATIGETTTPKGGGATTVYLEGLGTGTPPFTGASGGLQTATLTLPAFSKAQLEAATAGGTAPTYCPVSPPAS